MASYQEFMEIYKELESKARIYYDLSDGESIVHALSNDRRFARWKTDIKTCSHIRNLYSHCPPLSNAGDGYIVGVSNKAIELMKTIITNLDKKLLVSDVCVRRNNIYARGLEDIVRNTIVTMHQRSYTHVPIIEDGKVVGVFDEKALFSYVADSRGPGFTLDNGLRFGDIKDYISTKNREKEDILFCGMNYEVDKLIDNFEEQFNEGKRLRLVLVTSNGKENGTLQGLLTAWDVLGKMG